MNLCHYCGTSESLTVLTRWKKKDGSYGATKYACRSCNRDRARKYYKTPSGKASFLRSGAKYRANNPERPRAWSKAHAIEKQPCEVCGNPKSHRHHPDISKPLEVVFLCAYHHKLAEA